MDNVGYEYFLEYGVEAIIIYSYITTSVIYVSDLVAIVLIRFSSDD